MIAAAQEDGAHLVVTSAYRSYERQEELFVSMIREYLAMGYSNAEAYAATKRLRNVPGTSEHQTAYGGYHLAKLLAAGRGLCRDV